MEQIRNYIDIGGAFEAVINWLMANMGPVFDAISTGVRAVLDAFNAVLSFPPPLVMTEEQLLQCVSIITTTLKTFER